METIHDLELEISAADEGSEKEELERTLVVCQEMLYLYDEGFIEVEECEDEEIRIYPTGVLVEA